MADFIRFLDVSKRYKMGEVQITAADKVSLTIDKGEFTAIVGPSGAGKTTVLNILGGMDSCDGGEVVVDGLCVSNLSARELATYRRHDVGYVFQFYNLVHNLTALENVELATQICKNPLPPEAVLERVGLGDRMDNFPSQLSGGEQQRVAIARALAKQPKLLLCDEPTGALDFKTGKTILKLLVDMSVSTGMTVVVITHNLAIAPIAHRVIRMGSGRVSDVVINENPVPVDEIEW